MARSIETIQQQMIDNLQSKGIVVSDSVTSIRRIWTWVIAFAHYVLERILDVHIVETDEKIAALKPGTLNWYGNKALDFQLGGILIQDSDEYDNTGLSEAQIDAQKIIANKAVVKEDGVIKIKIVRNFNGDYAPLDNSQLIAFSHYMLNEVQYAGDDVVIVNATADAIAAEITIIYDPSIMKANGDLFDGTIQPVRGAAKSYFKNTNFNGRYFKSKHIETLLTVSGVTDAKIENITATDANGTITAIDMQYQPFSGFMRFLNDTGDNAGDLKIYYQAQQ
jgi:hypothetical protein